MRLATLAAVTMLLAAVGPTLATHNGGTDDHRIPPTGEVAYEDSMTIEDDLYVKTGYWSGDVEVEPFVDLYGVGGGRGVDNVDDPANASVREEQEIAWLWIHDDTDVDDDSIATVEVETEGPVVAAMDVFKVFGRDDAEFTTPDCPQALVEDLYPDAEEGPISWVVRLARQTNGYHQRGGALGSLTVELDARNSPRGFLVAIYPQAASGHEDVESAAGGAPQMTWTVSARQDDTFVTDNVLQSTQPDLPVHAEEWVGGPGPLLECAGEGVPLPEALQEESVEELPGAGSPGQRMADLLDADLPEDPT